jgi:predicted Zn-dependent protease
LARQPDNTVVLANLSSLLAQQGRNIEAARHAARLTLLEPIAPFQDYQLGRAAMAQGDHADARSHFARQIEITPDDADSHYLLALANYALGDVAAARQHLAQAVLSSSTRHDRDLYAAKLDLIRARRNE